MTIFLLLIPFVGTLLGFWIVWRLASINLPDPPETRDTAWVRGVVPPKDFVGPVYHSQNQTKQEGLESRGPHFWSEDEP